MNSMNQVSVVSPNQKNRQMLLLAIILLGSVIFLVAALVRGPLAAESPVAQQNSREEIALASSGSTVRYFKESTTGYMNLGEAAAFALQLGANPELKVLDYPANRGAAPQLSANPELKVLESAKLVEAASGLYANPELKTLSYAPTD